MIRFLTIGLLVAGLAALLLAPAATAAAPAAHPGLEIQGVILGVDAGNHLVLLHTRRGVLPVKFTRETRIAVNGRPAPPRVLERGMRAVVTGRPGPLHRVLLAQTLRARGPRG